MYSLFFYKSLGKFLKCDKAISARIYYLNYSIDLLSGKTEQIGINSYLKKVKKEKIFKQSIKPKVTHWFYELGHILNGESLSDPLVIEIEYDRTSWLHEFDEIKLDLKQSKSLLTKRKYKDSFDKIREHLLNGDCYQVNLTRRLKYEFNSNVDDIISSLFSNKESLGSFAHCSYIPQVDKLFLSNSPECLFQLGENYIESMPIKGTIELKGDQVQAWKELERSEKNRAELDMITDLIRNDLSRIEDASSVVKSRRAPLAVPGLLHQFSHIEQKLSENVSTFDVFKSLFPGGSITGAPKKRVMKIIQKIEKSKRGFYTGSTFLNFKKTKAASINIRSSEWDFKTNHCTYGSGGGLTLQSDSISEFKELIHKEVSFFKLIASDL